MKKIFLIFFIICGFAFFAPEKKPTIFLVGDSTMANKPTDDNPERGWGQMFSNFLTSDVELQNHAVNGRSTKSFIKVHRWDTVMSKL